MIIHRPEQDMFTDDVQAIVCPVNLNGVMGAGLAKYFAMRDPMCHMNYLMDIRAGRLKQGTITVHSFNQTQKVIFLPTKINWWEDSPKNLITESLMALAAIYQSFGLTSIGLPMIGCGCGNLPWTEVREIIYSTLALLPINVVVYGK